MPKKTLMPPMILPTPFGVWLKQMREARELSQAEVANLCQVTQEYISGLERGTRNPSRKLVWRLAECLSPENITADEAGEILNEAIARAFGIDQKDRPVLSMESLRYATAYENADDRARELLEAGQELIVKAIRSTGKLKL